MPPDMPGRMLIGAGRLELPTSRSRTVRSTKLSYAPSGIHGSIAIGGSQCEVYGRGELRGVTVYRRLGGLVHLLADVCAVKPRTLTFRYEWAIFAPIWGVHPRAHAI